MFDGSKLRLWFCKVKASRKSWQCKFDINLVLKDVEKRDPGIEADCIELKETADSACKGVLKTGLASRK